MRFAVLGSLQVVAEDRGEPANFSAPRLRVLLAVLLWQANQPVSVDELAELIWDGIPPAAVSEAVRTLVKRLRRRLGPRAAARVMTRSPGYMIEVSGDELDALRFETLTRRAGEAVRAGQLARAAQSAAEALSLWRGTPLADIPSQLLRDQWVPRLDQLRMQALDWRIEGDLLSGRHEQLIPELRDLAERHPLREHFHSHLMLALYRCGRQAEALAAYQHARDILVTEVGVEPGPGLRDLHQRILSADPALGAPPDTRRSGDQALPRWSATEVPRQLPAAAGHFTGRDAELAWLADLAARCEPQAGGGGTAVISAIDGMAGIGKTALAVHAAHRVSDWFPDGQLFVDLHGYTKGHSPREPANALGTLLRALRVPAQRIPEDTQERAALYRQRLAGTKTLVLLDNAADEAQVRPLLPAAPGCLVLVTSRRRLKGLDDARSVSLGLLASRDAVALLGAVAGPDRVPADDPLLGEIARQCGWLPLALRIAGALLRHRHAWNPEYLTALLRDEHRRVPVLSDGERDLATVFDLSYMGVSARHRLLLRRLAVAPGLDADAHAVAALLDIRPDIATGLLEDLVDHNLLIAHAPGRYRLHDLIRSHARILAATDPAPERDATRNGCCG